MAKSKPTIQSGNFVGLALKWKVPHVTANTPRGEAMAKLSQWLALEMLRKHGPPPGWTATEYRAYIGDLPSPK